MSMSSAMWTLIKCQSDFKMGACEINTLTGTSPKKPKQKEGAGIQGFKHYLKKLDVCILLQVGYNHNTTGALSIANQRSNDLLQRFKVVYKT